MRGVNRVFIVGRLGQDPEVRQSAKGEPWCKFTVATNRNRKDGDGNWTEEADWHDVKAFGRTAEQCAQFLARGSAVAIEGALGYRKWKDDEGKTRVSTSVLADRVSFLDKKKEGAEETTYDAPVREAPPVPEMAIPF